MATPPSSEAQPEAPTREIAEWVARDREIDALSLRWARHCLLDWLAVTVAGAADQMIDILIAEALEDSDGGIPVAGRAETLSPSWAVLVNGTASHALDYDDVNTTMHGHPTVAVLPALLVAAVKDGRSMEEVLRAFVVGYEVCCLVGEMTGDRHYDSGWHATATVGTFGATAGMCALLGLDAERTAHALGTAATTAAGLKSMFGTMCKPFHAGRASQSGYLAARTAARGWVARGNALECAQGFWDTQAPDHAAFPVARQDNQPFQVQNNLFKYHAACYLTHSSIEACRGVRESHGIDPSAIERVRLKVAKGHLRVCGIPDPETGLEIKFSLRHTAAMALAGVDTGAADAYSDAMANRPDLVALRQKIEVEPQSVARTMVTGADVVVELADGMTLTNAFDVGIPATDVDAQEARLLAKFDALVEPVLGTARTEALRAAVLSGAATPAGVLGCAH